MAPQQHTRALYYTKDQTIEEVLIDSRGDASHVVANHPRANGNHKSLTFKIRYEHAFTNPQEEYPVSRYQPTAVREQDEMHFRSRAPKDVLAVISEDGKVYRNTLVDDEDVDYQPLITAAKQYFSHPESTEQVA